MFASRDPLGESAGDRLGEAYSGVAKCEELGECSLAGRRDYPDNMVPSLSNPLMTPQVKETHSPRWSVQ